MRVELEWMHASRRSMGRCSLGMACNFQLQKLFSVICQVGESANVCVTRTILNVELRRIV